MLQRVIVGLALFFFCTVFSMHADCPFPNENPENPPILYLEDLIDLGLQNNPKTMKAWLDIKIAAANLKISESTLYPFVDYSYKGELVNEKTSFRIPDQIDLLRGTSLRGTSLWVIHYLLLDFGERCNLIRGAFQALVSMGWTYEQTIQRIMLDILLAYYNHVQTKMQWEASVLDLKNAEDSLNAVKAKQEVRYALITDLLQAQSTYLSAKTTEINWRSQMQISKGFLAKVIGMPADAPFQVPSWDQVSPPDYVSENIESLMMIALSMHPELKARKADANQKYSLWRASQTAGWPKLNFDTTFLNTGFKKTDISHIHDYRFALSVEFPLFHGFFYEAQEEKSLREYDKSLENWREAELAVMNDVWASYFAFQNAKETYVIAKENVQVAERSFSATLEAYGLGTREITDLIVAQTQISSARQTLIQIETAYLSSLSSLAFALGILGLEEYGIETCK